MSGVDLTQWLTAQLDADTARATAAAEEGGPEWRYDGDAVVTRRERDLVAIGSQDYMEAERGEFIAEHDPARVLREIEAKREIVRQANLYLCDSGPGCGYRTKHGHSVLRLLALPYADRPGYQEAWRP